MHDIWRELRVILPSWQASCHYSNHSFAVQGPRVWNSLGTAYCGALQEQNLCQGEACFSVPKKWWDKCVWKLTYFHPTILIFTLLTNWRFTSTSLFVAIQIPYKTLQPYCLANSVSCAHASGGKSKLLINLLLLLLCAFIQRKIEKSCKCAG